MYRIKYWSNEFNGYCFSGIMSLDAAKRLKDSNVYRKATIVLDEMGFPEYKEPTQLSEIIKEGFQKLNTMIDSFNKDNDFTIEEMDELLIAIEALNTAIDYCKEHTEEALRKAGEKGDSTLTKI